MGTERVTLFFFLSIAGACSGDRAPQATPNEDPGGPVADRGRDAAEPGGEAARARPPGAKAECPADTECTWDENGRILREVGRGERDHDSYRRTYRYDDQGRVVDEVEESGYYASTSPFHAHRHYTYDDRGHRKTAVERHESSDKPEGTWRRCEYEPPCPPPYSACKESCTAWKEGRPVDLAIDEVKVASRAHTGSLVTLEATLDNHMESALAVRSSFFSAFDGFSVVVATPGGNELARQPYIHHQSPQSSSGTVFPLPVGKTTHEMVFPLEEKIAVGTRLHVRLAGGLPGTELETGLVSNTVNTEVVAGSH